MGLDVGSVLSDTFRMLGRRFWPMLGLWAIFLVVQIVALFVMGGAIGVSGMMAGGPESMGAGMIVLVVVFYLIFFMINFAQSASLSHMASSLHDPGLGDSLNAGMRSAPTLLGVTVLFMIAYFVVTIPLAMIVALLARAAGGITVLLVLALIPLAIYVTCRLILINQVVSIERIGNPITAISRSWTLTSNNVLPIFAVLVIFGIGSLVLLGVVAAPLFAAVSNAAPGTVPDFAAVGIFSIFGMFIVFVVLGLAWAAVGSAIHAALAGHVDRDSIDAFA